MTALQVIWFLLVGILVIGYAILDGFDLGVGCWHLFTKRSEDRAAFIRSIEPFWDGNEVWLLTGGGALFAAFPPVYATVFSGFYLAMMLVLLGLIFRAVAIEFRHRVEHPGWTRAWDIAFALGSILPSLLYGVAVGNVLRGLPLDAAGDYTGGFFALLNPFALLCGLTGLSMFALHGALYLALKMEGPTAAAARRWATGTWFVFLVLFVVTAGFGLKTAVYGLLIVPLVPVLAALLSAAAVFVLNKKQKALAAFLASGCTIAFVMLAVAGALFPNLVPCSSRPEWSLTVFNSSSSELTLRVMLIIALIGMPVVLGYTWLIHRIFRGKVSVHEH